MSLIVLWNIKNTFLLQSVHSIRNAIFTLTKNIHRSDQVMELNLNEFCIGNKVGHKYNW